MKFWLLIAIYLMSTFSVVNAQEFGPNPDALILSFDMQGGQKPRTADGPVLQIYANGTVITRATKPGDSPLITQISEDDQIALFNELVDDSGILNITTESIEHEIKTLQPQLRQFPDTPVTSLSIDLPKGSTSIRIKGVSAQAYLVPEAASLQSLFSVQRLLLDFAQRVNAESE